MFGFSVQSVYVAVAVSVTPWADICLSLSDPIQENLQAPRASGSSSAGDGEEWISAWLYFSVLCRCAQDLTCLLSICFSLQQLVSLALHLFHLSVSNMLLVFFICRMNRRLLPNGPAAPRLGVRKTWRTGLPGGRAAKWHVLFICSRSI